MQSKARTVKEYLASLPEDRRDALQRVREVILKNLPAGYEEGMQYGMIGYFVPHRLYPPGYHCDPKQPLPFAGLASQKGHMSVYLMCLYGDPALNASFTEAWLGEGKRLDKGQACIRFKKVEDLALGVPASTIRRCTVKRYIAAYEAGVKPGGAGTKAAATKKTAPAKKTAPKTSATGKTSTRKKAARKKSKAVAR